MSRQSRKPLRLPRRPAVAPSTSPPDARSLWETASRRLVSLCFIAFSVFHSNPGPFTRGQGLAAVLLGAFCTLMWLIWALEYWILPRRWLDGAALALPVAFGLAGAVLAGLEPSGAAAVFAAGAALALALHHRPAVSLPLAAAFAVVMLVTGVASGHVATVSLAWSTLIYGLYAVGAARRSRAKQLESVEQLLAETRRANAEQAHSAALAERGRIAREIHDVLAHSLAALTVQLEAADGLLTAGQTDRAHDYVVKARRIAREGLVETRRAVTALREDLPPLPALLGSLAENYRADVGAGATVTVLGEPRPLSAETALTVYRTAQESLTNVRKHAPGAKVELTLAFEPELTRLTVLNGPGHAAASPLAGSGGGYGLAGLRERAELAAGTLTAQPVARDRPAADRPAGDAAGEGWAVTLTIPAVN
jgi:signal transduction histidine kinase